MKIQLPGDNYQDEPNQMPAQNNQPQKVAEPSKKLLETSDAARESVKRQMTEENRRIEDSLRKSMEQSEDPEPKKRKKKGPKKMINPNPVTNEDYYKNYQRRVRNNKMKKIAVYCSIIFFLASLLVMNVYFVFFREQLSVTDIAVQVKSLNKINNYPSEAVDGYLQEHGYELISGIMSLANGSGAKTFTISNIRVNKIAVRSDNNANVYFSCYVNTNVGSESHNFLLPLYYDAGSSSFAPSGDLILCAVQNNSTAEPIDASLWDFGKIKKYGTEETTRLTNFLTNFLEILYNNPGNDLSTFYSGDSVLGDYSCEFLGIQECRYYQESNPMGLNCEVVFTLKSSEGVVFTVHNYAAVKKMGESYEIVHFY